MPAHPIFAPPVPRAPSKIAAPAKTRRAWGPSFVSLARRRSCEALKSPRNATGIAMTNLHRSPPMNQSETDLGIANESQLLGFGIRHRPARLDRYSASDQGHRRDPGRHRGDVMQSGLINSPARSMSAKAIMPMINGRPDYQLADALTKVSPQAQAKAKATATDFDAMFLNSVVAQVTSGIQGAGPFGD